MLAQTATTAVTNCLTLIRASQLPDGAFNMKAGDTVVWINPYFSSFAALALVAAHEKSPNPADLARVRRFLLWYAAKQKPDGTINDHTGRLNDYNDNGKRDSVDSYAAMFLIVIDRHHRAAKGTPAEVIKAAKLALKAIQSVKDVDGLTWAKPDHRVKYLMDQLETRSGLVAGERFFTAIGAATEAKACRAQITAMDKKLDTYWHAADGAYAWVLHPSGVYERGLVQPYPHVLANLFALAWMPAKRPALWAKIQKTFKPDTGLAPAIPVERWLVAASVAGTPAEVAHWRNSTIKEAAAFKAASVYIQRPAVAILAILEGAAWQPRNLR